MKIVLAGGTGHLGTLLSRDLRARGHQIVVLSRGRSGDPDIIFWDGRSAGPWEREIDGADAVINLAGRSVNCRYTRVNLREMMDSRVDSTQAIGRAIEKAQCAPRVWLQMSTATIYSHRFDAPNNEAIGRIGGSETNAPARWRSSIEIARAWERALDGANTPATRKVTLRAAVVMSPEPDAPFSILLRLTRLGLGGPIAGGNQFVSWIHDRDFVRAVSFLLERDDLAGPINLAAPGPVPQRAFMAALRAASGVMIGLPATRWMAAVGAFALQTETELILKSRRVIPGRLLDSGFHFDYSDWRTAADDLVARQRQRQGAPR